MKLNTNIFIKTKRLILKPIEEKYIDDIYESFTSEVTKFMPFNPKANKNEIIDFVLNSKKGLLEKTDIVFVVLDIDEKFTGCCGIHNINPESIEVGLWLKKESQGQGFGTEIITKIIEFIEQNFKVEYILYPVDEENIASRKIPEKLGFIPFKTYKKRKTDTIDLNIIEYRKYYS
ncbi:GNAT family N-acetyltransferase [Flavobacterium sp. PL02]|uniref:GNAT family N-acetyltransferase n=1 Tax=Flavobacterium sp. PL02 TaxID=3088354 RepID=UPI002B2293C9|nr:GNAT family N-acetyltransferase [Flavobacterium sp. PL02]MEA9414931.1 GNAT family N-acetyltransferase [Flavobacterium sp. PL02]